MPKPVILIYGEQKSNQSEKLIVCRKHLITKGFQLIQIPLNENPKKK